MSIGLAFVPWLAFWPGLTSWQGSWIGWMAIVWIGWLNSAVHGKLSAIPIPVVFLSGWAGLLSIYHAQIFLARNGTIPDLLLVPGLCLISALAAIQWIGGFTEKEERRALFALRISILLLVAYGYFQFFNIDQFQAMPTGGSVLGGTLGNETHFGCLLAITLSLWNGRWVIVAYASLILIALTGSITAIAAACISLIIMRRFGLLIFLFIFGNIAVSYSGQNRFLDSFGRFEAWSEIFKLWKKSPIIGFGLGSLWAISHSVPSGHPLHGWNHAHNEYLQVLLELGAIGISLFAWVFLNAYKRFKSANRLYVAILISSCVCAFTNFPWHITQTAVITIFAYGRIMKGVNYGIL